ncbi:MAG: T9SS type A sorting domain-containing protein, partial [Bacteroidia bacterium]|nr:T9SS type A sorting domain-containing protein [Bacteroidia bacterium]
NFDIEEKEIIPNFTTTGTWYNYWTGDSLTVTDTGTPISLIEGEYRLYTSRKLPAPPFIGIDDPYYNMDGEVLLAWFYPNPTTGIIHIETDEKELLAFVFDQSGRKLIQATIFGVDKSTLDLGSLKQGMYFIRFTAQGKVPYTGKVIKY